MPTFKKLVKIILLFSICLFVFSCFQKDNFPKKEEIVNELYQEPLQAGVEKAPFQLQEGEFTYMITPKYTYELYGLVVSYYDSENWLDLWHKNDPLNTKDVCVIWGDNIKSGVYQKMKFSHGEFTCYAKFKKGVDFSWYSKFYNSQISNNHLLPKNDEIYEEMKNVSSGDQIYFKGYLVDYSVKSLQGGGGTRATSTIRADTGNGACEIIYATDFQILKKGNLVHSAISGFSKYTMIICFFILLILVFKL